VAAINAIISLVGGKSTILVRFVVSLSKATQKVTKCSYSKEICYFGSLEVHILE
jgi:hypothetical protein